MAFSGIDHAEKVKFLKEIFLVVNISPDMDIGIFIFILSSANIIFIKKKLWSRFYINKKAFFATKQIKLVQQKEFIVATLDLRHKNFVIYIFFYNSPNNN